MKLVDDWKQGWRWISVNCMALSLALQGTWLELPDDLKATIPHNVVHVVSMVLLGIGIIGRFKKQGSKNADDHS